jgi:hypothetical protein
MGAFNDLHTVVRCSYCHELTDRTIQFKYGDTWQHDYQVGDALRWGGNDVGEPGLGRVRVRGVSDPCPTCGQEDQEFYVIVENDHLNGVEYAPEKTPLTDDDLTIVDER